MKNNLPLPDDLFGRFARSTARAANGSNRRGFISILSGFGLLLVAPVEAVFGQEGGCTPDPNDGCSNCCGQILYNSCTNGCCNYESTYYLRTQTQQCCGKGPPLPTGTLAGGYSLMCCLYNCQTCIVGGVSIPCHCTGAAGYDPLYEGCCPKNGVYNLALQGCCGDGIYTLSSQACCDGLQKYSKSSECCCGKGDGTHVPCVPTHA